MYRDAYGMGIKPRTRFGNHLQVDDNPGITDRSGDKKGVTEITSEEKKEQSRKQKETGVLEECNISGEFLKAEYSWVHRRLGSKRALDNVK
jgi:hypothetical protein